MRDAPPPTYRRTLRGFEPVNAAAEAFWKDTKLGYVVKLDGKRPRNLARHNLYWAVCTLAAENMGEYATAARLHLATKIALGLCKPVPALGRRGPPAFEADSTSFASMPEHEFRQFMDQAFELWSNRLGVPIETLTREAEAA